jgi:hypothetical protein
MRRRLTSTSLRPSMAAMTASTSTAMVVILAPPAVEPGAPPMNMRTIISVTVVGCSAFGSTE